MLGLWNLERIFLVIQGASGTFNIMANKHFYSELKMEDTSPSGVLYTIYHLYEEGFSIDSYAHSI